MSDPMCYVSDTDKAGHKHLAWWKRQAGCFSNLWVLKTPATLIALQLRC